MHTGVPDWADYTRRAEIVVAAAGVPGILQPEHITPGAVVVGGGVRYEGRKLLPDVDEACNEVAGAITPRIGGVGPTTVAMLFRNCVEAAERAASRRAPPLVIVVTGKRSAGAADVGVGVGRQRAYDAGADDLVGEPGPPVDALGDAELLVEPQQVLLDRGLGDDQLVGDLLRRGRRDEGVLLQRRAGTAR